MSASRSNSEDQMRFDSVMDVFYDDGRPPDLNWPCVVLIRDDELVVEYYDGGLVTYVGARSANSLRIDLFCSSPAEDGYATLSGKLIKHEMLVDNWHEGGITGTWTVF